MNNPEVIRELYEGEVDLVIDGGLILLGPSTVLDLTEDQPVIIRKGAGDVSMLSAA